MTKKPSEPDVVTENIEEVEDLSPIASELYPDDGGDDDAQPEEDEKNQEVNDEADEPDEEGDGDEKAQGDEDDGDDDEEKREYSRRVQKRINKLTAQNRELQRKLEEFERKLLTTVNQDDKQAEQEIAEPDPNDYDLNEHDPKYIRDLLNYEREKIRAEVEKIYEEKKKLEAQSQYQTEFQQQVKKFWELGASKYEDFEDLKDDDTLVVDPALAQAFVQEPEYGVEAAHYLANNPKELEKVSKLDSVKQLLWFGKYSAQLELKKKQAEIKRKSTKAPTIKPIKGSRGVSEEDKPLHELLYPDD